MEFSMQWNMICRICLHEGEMRSIFDKDDKNMTICDKILKCSNIMIKKGMSLPEQICKGCLEDLEAAYRFRSNCESSDAILQSFLDSNVVADLIVSSGSTGEVFKFKPPGGLSVKRVKTSSLQTKLEADTTVTDNLEHDDTHMIEDNAFMTDDYIGDDNEENTIVPSSFESAEPEKVIEISPNIKETITSCEVKEELPKELKTERIEVEKVNEHNTRSKTRAAKQKQKTAPVENVSTKKEIKMSVVGLKKYEEEKPVKICEICGNTYKYKHALESHMRRHRNEKPFACEICGRAFVINFELRRHMRTHTGQKPYMCRFCGRRFSDFGSRIKHERTHTGERPYVCETCGKAFSYSHVLQSHILTHTGEKRYECTLCCKRFTKSHHLKAHMNTHMKNVNKPVIVKKLPEPLPQTTWTEAAEITNVLQTGDEPKVFFQSNDEKIFLEANGEKVFFIKDKTGVEDLNLGQLC